MGFVKPKACTVLEALYKKKYAQVFYFYKFYKTYDQVNIAKPLESERSKNSSFISFVTHPPLDTQCIQEEKKSLLFLLSLLFMS